MNAKPAFALLSIILSISLYAQSPIEVTDQTLKIGAGKSEEIFIGFAAGDRIIFNFQEINGKELKEIEILEYPDKSRFSDFKVDKIIDKTITVPKQSVYLFRFKNSAIAGRVCKIHIQRIPSGDLTKDFNTSVTWIIKQDTSWNTYTKDIVVGYDTTYVQKTKKEVVRTEQKEEIIFDKNQRVHSETNKNGNRTFIFFTLPENTITPNKTSKVISWAYWIGVGKEAEDSWNKNKLAIKRLATSTAGILFSPLGALAVGTVTELLTPKLGEDVYYAITDEVNKGFFLNGQQYRASDFGKGVAGYKKFTNSAMCQGRFFICLSNDNIIQGIDASVKVSAIVETSEFVDKTFTEMIVNPKLEKQLFRESQIQTYKTAVTGI